jgi:hypothetical protein
MSQIVLSINTADFGGCLRSELPERADGRRLCCAGIYLERWASRLARS